MTETSSKASKYAPTVYNLALDVVGPNFANLTATTSYEGIVYYAIVPAGTPETLLSSSAIYDKTLKAALIYGTADAIVQSTGVNTVASISVSNLEAYTSYRIVVYLNATTGVSSLKILDFKTAKVSNPAAIKLAMSNIIVEADYIIALSKVLRISSDRIYVLTNKQVHNSQQQSYQVNVMNERLYVYDTLVTPDPLNDVVRPIDLLDNFLKDSNAQSMFLEFMPNYLPKYKSTTREVFKTVPRNRYPVHIMARTYESVTCSVAFWGPVFVHAVILENNGTLLSSQIINGLDQNN